MFFWLSFLLLFAFATSVQSEDAAPKLECNSQSLNNDRQFPAIGEGFGAEYQITLRSTDRHNGGETAKFVENNFNGSVVVHKSTRKMEAMIFNRSVLYEDHFSMQTPNHMTHNRSCKSILSHRDGTNNSSLDDDTFNLLGLSRELRSALKFDGNNFGELLKLFAARADYNGTLHDQQPLMGVEVVGWLGCSNNFSGSGFNLQLKIASAADHTPEQPYNPYLHNPLFYSMDLIFYKDGNASKNETSAIIFDSLTFDLVAMERLKPSEKNFSLMPPRGVYCSGMPSVKLPENTFPQQMVLRISSTRYQGAIENQSFYNKYFFDWTTKIIAFSENLFFGDKSNAVQRPNLNIIHDFEYGFQFIVAVNGTCQSVSAIDLNSPDVSLLPDNSTGSQLVFMHTSEELLIWGGRRQKIHNNFYYAGQIYSTFIAKPLAVFVTTRPSVKQKWEERGSSVNSLPRDNTDQLVELLFMIDEINGKPSMLHSIIIYNGTSVDARNRIATHRFIDGLQKGKPHFNTWHTLQDVVDSCVLPFHETGEEMTENGEELDADHEFFVQLGNVSFRQFNSIGFDYAKSVIAEGLAEAANISQLRIVEMHLKQFQPSLAGAADEGKPNLFATALFTIIEPISKIRGVKPTKTFYYKPEISVFQAANNLNKTIAAGALHVRIPLGGSAEMYISVSEFGHQRDLCPAPPPTPLPPRPTPLPPAPSKMGYSGSSLAICTVFAFLAGNLITIGVYVFYQRRTHIRGLAYQIFE